jgi:AcrR family transcriptional regulator
VYAHFHDRQQLVEELVARAVGRAMAAVESAEPERGPARDALQRVLSTSWEHLADNEEIGRASAADLKPDAMRRAHEAARAVIHKLVERGRRDGAFRTDVTTNWLVTTCLALVHAAAEEVRSGELDPNAAFDMLSLTVADLFARRDA